MKEFFTQYWQEALWLAIGIAGTASLFIAFLYRELVLSRKLKKKIFLIGSSSDKASKIRGILKESIFKFENETGDLDNIDKLEADECLLIGLIYSGYEAGMDRILEVAQDNKLPLIVYCADGQRLEGEFKEKLDRYRWFDMCITPYRFVSIAFSAITANHHQSLLKSIKQKICKKLK